MSIVISNFCYLLGSHINTLKYEKRDYPLHRCIQICDRASTNQFIIKSENGFIKTVFGYYISCGRNTLFIALYFIFFSSVLSSTAKLSLKSPNPQLFYPLRIGLQQFHSTLVFLLMQVYPVYPFYVYR